MLCKTLLIHTLCFLLLKQIKLGYHTNTFWVVWFHHYGHKSLLGLFQLTIIIVFSNFSCRWPHLNRKPSSSRKPCCTNTSPEFFKPVFAPLHQAIAVTHPGLLFFSMNVQWSNYQAQGYAYITVVSRKSRVANGLIFQKHKGVWKLCVQYNLSRASLTSLEDDSLLFLFSLSIFPLDLI